MPGASGGLSVIATVETLTGPDLNTEKVAPA